MGTLGAVTALECRSCEARVDPETTQGQCPDCGGVLTIPTDLSALEREAFETQPASMWDFEGLLPFDRESAVSMGEGGTPHVPAHDLAASFDIDQLWIKDEGQNPTGSVADRELSMAVTAATELGVERGSLAAPGAAGHSFAAYAARAGIDGTVFLPARARFEHKAMCNVHGASLDVVQGRLPEAEAERKKMVDRGSSGYPFGAFETPFRYLGASTIAFETAASMPDQLPDVITVPNGSGVPLVGVYEGFELLSKLDVIEKTPRLVAVEPTGCAPIVEAVNSGDPVQPVAVPDTICGELEVPNPTAGSWAIEAITQTGGRAVAVSDDEILDTGVTVAQKTGLELSPDAAAGLAGVQALRTDGFLSGSASVLSISTGTGGADLLKSYRDTSG